MPDTSQGSTALRDKIKVPVPEFFSREKGKLEYFLFQRDLYIIANHEASDLIPRLYSLLSRI